MIEIVRAGFQVTVEDAGRAGWRHLGVAPGGALDALALEVGNRLVGNPPGAAGLEVSFVATGPLVLRATRALRIALSGADFGATLDGQPVWPWWSLPVRAGGELVLRAARLGMRGYVCVAGGIDVLPVLGSRSTDLLTGFGGLAGRALRTGDRLPVGRALTEGVPAGVVSADAPAGTRACLAPDAPGFGVKAPAWCRFSHAARLDAHLHVHLNAYLDERADAWPSAGVQLDAAHSGAHSDAHPDARSDAHPGTRQEAHLEARPGAHSSVHLDAAHSSAHSGTHQGTRSDGVHPGERRDAHLDARSDTHANAHPDDHSDTHPAANPAAHPAPSSHSAPAREAPDHAAHPPRHAARTEGAPREPQRPAQASPRRFAFADAFASESIQRALVQTHPAPGRPPPAEWVRVLPGPEYDSFTSAAREAFWASEWLVTPRSNRMGYRLSGTALERAHADELLSHAVLPGTIQVPPDGQPIVLMNDAQTTGGYPKIGVVIRADLWKLAQVRLNGGLRFVETTPDDARRALREVRAYLRQIDAAIALREGQYAKQR